MSRLYKKYKEEIVAALKKEFGLSSTMEVPRLVKVVVNCGCGEATQNAKALQSAEYAVRQMTGQTPVVTRSKKAIANFKVRENQGIGVMVTLRGQRMYNFVDRLVNIALPRERDFRGLPKRGFDGRGNYTMGRKEQIIFPEIDMEKMEKDRGMNITFVTTAGSDERGRALLTQLGMPFRK